MMSFYDFEQKYSEQEKLPFKQFADVSDEVAVYTWGEEGYDGLGDLLQEGRDELNDETFGDALPVGKDFDFSNPAIPEPIPPSRKTPAPHKEQAPQLNSPTPGVKSTHPLRSTSHSLEAIWDNKSPLSVLPRANGTGRSGTNGMRRASPALSKSSAHPPIDSSPISLHVQPQNTNGVRTLQEIEAEMVAAAQQSRTTALQQQQQQLLLQQEEDRLMFLQRQQEQELQRHILEYQEQQYQLQIERALQQQQRELQQYQRTPPPRMLPGLSQTPRFHEHQRQILLLQQQQEQQQQQRLQELQQRLRSEELERQLRSGATLEQSHSPNHFSHHRQPSGPTAVELQAAHSLQQQQRRRRSQSPVLHNDTHFSSVVQDSVGYLHQNVPLQQQRLLSELAQAEFIREMQGSNSQVEQEALRHEAMRKILEAERMEEKRRKKATKIAHMARYNDLMTQSDKDFITRIQVSQLVTQDPYADDFYAQVYGAILRSRMGIQTQDDRVLKFNSGGGVALGLGQKGGNRRPYAMLRMEQQVERIVSNARKREEEKGLHSIHSLQGALGRTSGRSYKAAPRQLLQVDSASSIVSPPVAHNSKDLVEKLNEGAAKEAAKLGREALGGAGDTDNLIHKDPLSHREILVGVENLYDFVLGMETLKRNEPTSEDNEEYAAQWKAEYDQAADQLWDALQVMVPLETSNPHPFISLLIPSKGKKILPRVTRHLSHAQMFTLLTLLVACFDQLDVVLKAPLLDTIVESRERSDVERQTEAFLKGVLHSILPVVARADLRLVTGLLGLLLDRTNIVGVAQSGAGIALLTLFLSRVEVMKQALASGAELSETPTTAEAQQWQLMFDHLFQLLTPHLPSLFPSTRIAVNSPPGHGQPADQADQPVWQLLAAIALHAVPEQHQVLVTALREKILENVLSVNKGWVTSEDERQTKLANVNLFLHALGLDSSQIAL